MTATRAFCFIFPIVIWLASCTGDQETAADNRPPDDLDTLYVRDSSILSIDRYRKYLNKNALFRLGKMKMNLTIDDLNTGVQVRYKIDSGMLVYNREFFTAQCFISTEAIKVPRIDSAQQLNLETPAYLMNGGKKHIVLEYKGNFYPRERTPSASCSLTINDTTGLLNNAETKVELKNDIISFIHTEAYVDGLKWKLYEPAKGESIQKDSIRINTDIYFEPPKKQDPKMP